MRTLPCGTFSRLVVWAVVAITAPSWPACGRKGEPPPDRAAPVLDGSDPGNVVLQVGPSIYRAGDFGRYAAVSVGGSWANLGAATLSQFFEKFVDDKLLLQAAQDEGVVLTAAEKREWIDKLKDEGWTHEEEAATLTADSGPLAERLKVEKYTSRLVQGLTVGEDEIRAYYEGHKTQFFLPERVEVSQILLPTEAAAVPAWEKLRGASEDDFRAVAKAESLGPEAAEGGRMGVFQKGQLPPEMEASVLSLQPGEISPIVESSYGFHIFRLDARLPAEQTTLQAASETIRLNLFEQMVRAALAKRLLDLRESLDWTAYPENLPFVYQKVP